MVVRVAEHERQHRGRDPRCHDAADGDLRVAHHDDKIVTQKLACHGGPNAGVGILAQWRDVFSRCLLDRLAPHMAIRVTEKLGCEIGVGAGSRGTSHCLRPFGRGATRAEQRVISEKAVDTPGVLREEAGGFRPASWRPRPAPGATCRAEVLTLCCRAVLPIDRHWPSPRPVILWGREIKRSRRACCHRQGSTQQIAYQASNPARSC